MLREMRPVNVPCSKFRAGGLWCFRFGRLNSQGEYYLTTVSLRCGSTAERVRYDRIKTEMDTGQQLRWMGMSVLSR